MKKIIPFLILLTVIVSSCKKDTVYITNLNPGSGSVAVVGLTGTSWILTASHSKIEFDANTILEFDALIVTSACSRDNILTFKANGRMTSDEGATKCSTTDPQIIDIGSWRLSADKKRLVLDQLSTASYGVPTLDSEILKFDDKVLSISYITYINGPKATTTQTYARVN